MIYIKFQIHLYQYNEKKSLINGHRGKLLYYDPLFCPTEAVSREFILAEMKDFSAQTIQHYEEFTKKQELEKKRIEEGTKWDGIVQENNERSYQ